MIGRKCAKGFTAAMLAGVLALGGLSQTAFAEDSNVNAGNGTGTSNTVNPCGTTDTTASICLQNITKGHTYKAYPLGVVTAGAVSDAGLATNVTFTSAEDRNTLDYARSAKDIMSEVMKTIGGDANADPLTVAMGWVKSDAVSNGSSESVINTTKQDSKMTAFLDGIDNAIRHSIGQENTPTIGNGYTSGNALMSNLKPATVYLITDTDENGKAGVPRLAGTSEAVLNGSVVSVSSMEGYSIPNTVTVKSELDDISITFKAVDKDGKPVKGRKFTISGGKLTKERKATSKADGTVSFTKVPFAGSYDVTLLKSDGSAWQGIVVNPKSTTTVNGATNEAYYDILDHTNCGSLSCFKDDDKTDGKGLLSPDSTATWRIPVEKTDSDKDTKQTLPKGDTWDNTMFVVGIAAILLAVLIIGIFLVVRWAIRFSKAHRPLGR